VTFVVILWELPHYVYSSSSLVERCLAQKLILQHTNYHCYGYIPFFQFHVHNTADSLLTAPGVEYLPEEYLNDENAGKGVGVMEDIIGEPRLLFVNASRFIIIHFPPCVPNCQLMQ